MDVYGEGPAGAQHLQPRHLAGVHQRHLAGEIVCRVDGMAVDAQHHVPGLQPRLFSRPAGGEVGHQGALAAVQAQAVGDLRRHRLHGGADIAAGDLAVFDQLTADLGGDVGGDIEADAHRTSRRRIDRGVDPDHPAVGVEGRAA